MAKRDSSSPEECAKVIEARDSENYVLYKKLYGIRFGKDLSPFTHRRGDGRDPRSRAWRTRS